MTQDWSDIINSCRAGDRKAQKLLYEHHKRKFFVVCLRYANKREDAEDMLQEGFVKIFRDLHQYRGAGSFEGWMRKIILNTALRYVKQQRLKWDTVGIEVIEDQLTHEPDIFESNTTLGLIKLMQQLPVGFRTVLNLYVLEGYTHKQIAEELNISEGTSKSQLNRAKKHLKSLLDQSLTNT